MKKILSVSLVIAVLLTGLLVFTGCEKDDEKKDKKETDLSAVEGTYVGQYTKLVGDDTKETDEEFYLELNEDGTGKHHRDDYTFNVTWTLDGKDFKMTEKFVGDPIEYTGTLKDGKLDIFNGDPDDDWTYEYVYEKDETKSSKDDKDKEEDDDDNKLISSSSTTTTTTKTDDKKTTTDTDKKDDTKTTTTTSTTTGLRQEFKQTMDDYEDFIDDYIEFMKKYKNSNGTDTSMMSDYTRYMNKYSELSKNLQKYDANSMNSDELAYYMKVVQRSSEKIKEAGLL